ncbi:Na(+)/citrate cotransporter-like [Uloborus diversus]|uniref:Na(+)/citrate cotransporter-like n=1 Tax=Uloborus diversus TaxID=327109 RepID=UPI002409F416|nr:Na(+)/citrate cotransporter-like [Uloborus diversus]
MSGSCLRFCRRINVRLCIYVLSILLPFALSPLAASTHKESKCTFVMILVACYWLFEPVPVAVTALLPVVLFPTLGIVSSTEICTNYIKEPFMMFIGGLIVAIAVEDCRLHERIALKVLLMIGTELKWLMFGFMLTTMFLSMWISNTATTAMMVPIIEAVIGKIALKSDNLALDDNKDKISLTESKQVEEPEDDNFLTKTSLEQEKKNDTDISTIKIALLLSVCYAANIGGTGTLTGTGPNLVFKGLMEELHPDSDEINFATWMMYNIPGMVLCVLIGWTYIWLVYIRFSKQSQNIASKSSIKDIISKRYADLGSLRSHEAQVLVLFVILVVLWIFRDPKFITGWAGAMRSDTKIGDSVPAIGIAFLMFLLPSNIRDWSSRPILEWKTAQAKLPWGVIILAGGGFALADAAQKSGLSQLLGEKLSSLAVLSPGAIAAIVCFMTAMMTEIVTNTTSATILLPVFSQMAISIGVNPLFLMLPVTVVCSYAFMLPVATPPNAIAFESGNMKTVDMAKPGLVMNLVCCAVQLFMLNTLGVAMFNLNEFPNWANNSQISMDSDLISKYNNTFTNMTSQSTNIS